MKELSRGGTSIEENMDISIEYAANPSLRPTTLSCWKVLRMSRCSLGIQVDLFVPDSSSGESKSFSVLSLPAKHRGTENDMDTTAEV